MALTVKQRAKNISDQTFYSAINGVIIDYLIKKRHYWRMNRLPTIFQEIKAARNAKKLSQQEFAHAAGIPLRTYQRLESGDTNTGIDTLFRAINALGLTLKTASRTRPTLDELGELYGDDT